MLRDDDLYNLTCEILWWYVLHSLQGRVQLLLITERHEFRNLQLHRAHVHAWNFCYFCSFTCVSILLVVLTVQSNAAILFYRRHAVISKRVQFGMADITMAVFHLTAWLFIFSWVHADFVHADECTQWVKLHFIIFYLNSEFPENLSGLNWE